MSYKNYQFEEVLKCEMCGHDTKGDKVLGLRLNQSQGLKPRQKEGIAVSVKRCRNCHLIYSSPMPIPVSIQDHYKVPPESYWKPSYFEWSPDYFSTEIETLKSLIDFKPGMKALDIGAGIGKCMLSLAHAGFDAYGFEPSKPFYEKALTIMNIDPERLRLAMIEEVEYEANTFDFISFGAVFEHLYHPADCLQKSLRWLKPGGIIQIEVPSSRHLIPRFINMYYRLIGTTYVTNLSPMHMPFHLYEFDLDSFRKLAAKLDFEIVQHEYYVCDIFFFPKVLHPVLRRVMKATDTGMQLKIWLKKK